MHELILPSFKILQGHDIAEKSSTAMVPDLGDPVQTFAPPPELAVELGVLSRLVDEANGALSRGEATNATQRGRIKELSKQVELCRGELKEVIYFIVYMGNLLLCCYI